MRSTMTAAAERAPLHAHPRWSHSPIETRYRACHDTLTVHTHRQPATGHRGAPLSPITLDCRINRLCRHVAAGISYRAPPDVSGRLRSQPRQIVPQGAIGKLLSANLGGTL